MLLSPTPMHIPDGFLSLAVSILCWLITIATVGVAVVQANRYFNERQIPLMGVMAAFIFAAQMINFPVAGGTSGHLLGGALAAILLGPWAGILVMTAVIAVQGLLFQDGGLLAMGANILNMGVLTVTVAYGIYCLFTSTDSWQHFWRLRGLKLVGAGIAAWLSVITGALATALQLWLSGTARLQIVVPAMLGVHALIGFGEALVTVAALGFILRVRPDLIEGGKRTGRAGGWVFAGLLVALAVAILSPLASMDPDGLERVAINLGFFHQEQGAPYKLLANYHLPFLGSTPLSTILAGILGILVVLALVFLIGHSLKKKSISENHKS